MSVTLVLLLAAGGSGPDRARVHLDPPPPARAAFTITSAGREGVWHASTNDGCRFGFEMAVGSDVFTKGAFVREHGASCGPFLSRVAAALDAKGAAKARPKARLEFGATILGTDLRRTEGGTFSGHGGGWTATKLFLGDRQAEVYLNFNPHTGEAEFSIKDSDYGDEVLHVLASIL